MAWNVNQCWPNRFWPNQPCGPAAPVTAPFEAYWQNPTYVQRPVYRRYFSLQAQVAFSEEIPGNLHLAPVRLTQGPVEVQFDPRRTGVVTFARLTQGLVELQLDPRVAGQVTFARATQGVIEVDFDPRRTGLVTFTRCTQGVIEVLLRFGALPAAEWVD